jgi:FkbM family methyltransferase
MDMQEFQNRIAEAEKFRPVLTLNQAGKDVRYQVNSSMLLWRVHTLFSKEPDTIAWIATFGADEVLVDVGANVGMYAIWAAATRGCRVFAFEPESQNYALLNANIVLNTLGDRVVAYCLALSDETAFNVLNLSELVQGGSNHTFREQLDFNLAAMQPVYRQGCYATTLDVLVEQGVLPAPQHIKIDVDGIEHRVVNGMTKTLRNPVVRSVLIEINTALESHRNIMDTMSGCGFDYDAAGAAESVGRQKGTKFEGVGNYIFRRS